MATEMSVEAERAAFEAWASNIDHGYASFNGTRAPGNWYYFENDAQAAWAAWQASAARRAAQPADVGAGELPPLPEPKYAADDLADIYTADQMRQYARAALAHQAEPAQLAAAPKLPEGWIPLSIVYNEDMDHPEEVAYGPPVMMNRLGKWLDKFLAQEIAMRDGMVLVPHYRGYAHLGIGAYILNHSAKGAAAELVISVATEAEKAGRTVGDLQDNAPDAVVQPEAMAVRLRFENVAGLDALEQQLAFVRSVHFPDAAAPTSDQQAGAVAQAYTENDLVSMDQLDAIRATIKPGDGWSGDDWEFALANAVAYNVIRRAAPAAIEQAGAQPVAQALPTDEQITEIARAAVGAGELNWAGFKANTDGKYTIPAISPMEFGLCRAVVRALAAPTPAADQDDQRLKSAIITACEFYEQNMEADIWYGASMGVPEGRYEDVADEVIKSLAATPVTDQAATKQENQK